MTDQEECDSVERETIGTFDRVSVDASGFGPNHREKSDDDDTDRNDSDMRESCTTTGFDFYINNNTMGNIGTM